MNALVTGANGFVGSLIVKHLAARRDRVRALVRDPRRNCSLLSPATEICTGDLLDRDSLFRACVGVDVVFHTAALATHWSPLSAYWRSNVEGIGSLLDAMRGAGVPRLIHFSTYLVYGRRTGVRTENDPCQDTGDPYVDSKVAAEEVIRCEATARGIAWTILRPVNIYGPHDHNWMPVVARNITRRRMRLFGGAACPAAVVYGDDVAAFAVQCSCHPDARGEIFNVASPEEITWMQFFQTFATHLGSTFPSLRVPYSLIHPVAGALERLWRVAGAVNPPPVTRFGVDLLTSDWRCCVRKARERIGFIAGTAHKRGLEATVRWLREEGLLT